MGTRTVRPDPVVRYPAQPSLCTIGVANGPEKPPRCTPSKHWPLETRTRVNKLSHPFVAMAFVVALAAPALAAQPTLGDVQASIQAGHTEQADREIAQVLAAHPASAEARFVDARLLAGEGKWPLAQAELARAERLDPGMGFVPPQNLQTFKREVQDHMQAGPVKSSSAGLIALAAGFIFIFLYIMVGIFRAHKRGST